MHSVYQAYNMDDNTYTDVPYIKKNYPLYKIKYEDIYLLCYNFESMGSIINLIFYDSKNDKIINVFTIGNDSYEVDVFTRSTIFPNNYIVTVQSIDTTYYILSKIDYESPKFIELKKIEVDSNQSYNDLMNNAFETLGISITGELLEDNP